MPTIFELGIAYVANLPNFEAIRADAKAAGVRGLAVKVWDENPDPDVTANLAELTATYRLKLAADGFLLVGWACPRYAPQACALAMSDLWAKLGLHAVIFETEYEYKTDGGGVDVAALLNPWRVARPKAYTGVAVEGQVPTTFDHRAAIAAGCRLLPETYQAVGADHTAPAAMSRALSLGWARERVHVACSGVEGNAMAESLVYAYRARAVGFTHGLALWRGDELTADDYRLAAITAGDLYR